MTPTLKHIFYLLTPFSKNNYLVGGCVRDAFLGLPIKDYDIVTDVPIDISRPILEKAGFKTKECGLEFLVLHVSKKGEQYEISNFRKDGIYADGRRPTSVEIGTIEEDARRRDLSINAIFEDPVTGKILDPTGQGLSDLKNRLIRFIGKPQDRIREDYLRLWRALRFKQKLSKLGFEFEPKTQKVIRGIFREAYENSNPERVRQEIERMIE